MKQIDRYIARHLLMGSTLVLLLLVSLFSFLALAEELEDVGKSSFTALDAFAVVAFTLPKRVAELLPVTVLIGGLVGLGAMANHSEIVAIRASGFSPQRIAWPVFQVSLLLGLLVIAMQNFAIPKWEQQAVQLRAKTSELTVDNENDQSIWTRTGNAVVHVDHVMFGRSLRNVEIYELDQRGKLVRLIEAGSADAISAAVWLLRDVRDTELSAESVREQRLDTLRWQNMLSSEQVSLLLMPIDTMSPIDLLRYIRHMEDNRLETRQYWYTFWQQVSVPISIVAMCMLSLSFVMGSTRTVSVSLRVAIGSAVGILFYLGEQITGQMAALMNLNPALTAVGPDVLLFVISIVLLSRLR